VADILYEMIENWPGDDYDLLRRNCCHFADELSICLGVGSIPSYIHRFARIASAAEGMYAAFRRKMYGDEIDDE